jgi:hypothetical protein
LPDAYWIRLVVAGGIALIALWRWRARRTPPTVVIGQEMAEAQAAKPNT